MRRLLLIFTFMMSGAHVYAADSTLTIGAVDVTEARFVITLPVWSSVRDEIYDPQNMQHDTFWTEVERTYIDTIEFATSQYFPQSGDTISLWHLYHRDGGTVQLKLILDPGTSTFSRIFYKFEAGNPNGPDFQQVILGLSNIPVSLSPGAVGIPEIAISEWSDHVDTFSYSSGTYYQGPHGSYEWQKITSDSIRFPLSFGFLIPSSAVRIDRHSSIELQWTSLNDIELTVPDTFVGKQIECYDMLGRLLDRSTATASSTNIHFDSRPISPLILRIEDATMKLLPTGQ